MKIFCTVSDIGYINQGLALYESLIENVETDFVLYYLCIDKNIFNKISFLKLKKLIPIYAQKYDELKNITNTSQQGYAWELASRFCKWLIDNIDIDHIMYIDSDICFYKGVKILFEELEGKSVGIVPHLHLPPIPNVTSPGYPGGYNVGIIYFKNDKTGKECLDLWAYAVLNPYDEAIREGREGQRVKIVTHNTCGDQRFLEMFPMLYDTHIIGEKVNHGASWNLNLYSYENFTLENKLTTIKIPPNGSWIKEIIKDSVKEKPMIYMHFAGFKPDYKNNTYAATRERFNEAFMENQACRDMYDEYFELMKDVKEKYGLE